MMKRKRNILAVLVSLILLLGACGNSASSSADLSSYPKSVQDGVVSVEYYEQVSGFYSGSMPLVQTVRETIDKQKENRIVIYDEDYSSKLIDFLDKFNDLLENHTTTPSTTADKEIHLQLDKVIHFQLELNRLEINYLETKDNNLETKILVANTFLKDIVSGFDTVVGGYDLIE